MLQTQKKSLQRKQQWALLSQSCSQYWDFFSCYVRTTTESSRYDSVTYCVCGKMLHFTLIFVFPVFWVLTFTVFFVVKSSSVQKASGELLLKWFCQEYVKLCQCYGWSLLFYFQNFLRNQNNKTNYNLVCETLQFLDCICGSTTGGLGLLGLYINEKNVALVNQTLESLTEYCQGPCHENQVARIIISWQGRIYLRVSGHYITLSYS